MSSNDNIDKEAEPVASDSEDGLIFPRPKRRRRSYIPLSKLSNIFPEMEAETLCKLAELTSCKPISVLRLVPTATKKTWKRPEENPNKFGEDVKVMYTNVFHCQFMERRPKENKF